MRVLLVESLSRGLGAVGYAVDVPLSRAAGPHAGAAAAGALPARGGSGHGLALVKEIVTAHAGQARVGALFAARLPSAERKALL